MAHQVVDVAVVGAGIIGLATARELLVRRPSTSVLVVDKEPVVARHQSGRNSNVLHAGLYYRPGSAKALLCTEGRALMAEWCAEHAIAHRVPGKLVVATSAEEVSRLAVLARRAEANGVHAEWLGPAGIADHEPAVTGLAGLRVRSTGLVDFAEVCRSLADEVEARGGRVELGRGVDAVRADDRGIDLVTSRGVVRAGFLVNCAGVHAVDLARAAGARPGVRIVAFRGEYHTLAHPWAAQVRGLVYPVPDPSMPFLGVHLTRGLDEVVHVGPNAVVALGAEAYRWSESDPRALRPLLGDPAVRRMARRWWRAGVVELARSVHQARLVRELARLLPDIAAQALIPAPAGIRAQAVDDRGALVDDFAFGSSLRALHVLNAPSPAATASLAIARRIVDRWEQELSPTGT